MKIKFFILAIFALLLSLPLYAADELRASPTAGSGMVKQYGPGSSSWFMQYASTNTTLALTIANTESPAYWGYTNTTLFPVDIRAGSKVSLGVMVVFPDASCTNTMTIRAWPSLDGINKVTQPGVGVLESTWSCTLLGKGTTPVYWGTNAVVFNTNHVTVGASSAIGWPYLVVQFENPTNAAVAYKLSSLMPTNLVIQATVKP